MAVSFTTPPFRSIEDCVGGNGKFETPDIHDNERWTSKVLGNLIFFQTNYFVFLAVCFFPLLIFYTNDFALCIFASGAVLALARSLAPTQPMVAALTRGHPLLFLITIFAGGYLIILYVGSIYVYLLGIVHPVAGVFLHASFRSRTMRGRLISAAEKLGAMRTPMGVLLETLGETFEQLSTFS